MLLPGGLQGARTPSLVIGPPDEVGLVRVQMNDAVFDPERPFAYEYLRRLSTLYLVDGLVDGLVNGRADGRVGGAPR